MDVELFIHGVPSGEGFWGKEDDRNYFSTFYDHSSDEVKFLIQTRQFKGRPYCYYNYLVYKTVASPTPNIVGNDGRDGSYFGITLRLDAYCKDFDNMYRILDTIYNVYIIGSLLKMEKTKLKYTTPDFASVSSTLEAIEQATIQLIKNAFTNESFTRLEGFATNGGRYPTLNLFDCTWEKVLSLVKQYSRVALSPYYPSSKEAGIQQQCNAQIQSIQQQYEARIKSNAEAYAQEKNSINDSLSSVRNQLSQLQSEIKQKEETISQLKGEMSRVQTELKMAGQSKKAAQLIAPIKEPIAELATIFERIAPEPHATYEESGKKHKSNIGKNINSIIPYLNFIVLLLIVGILLNPFKERFHKQIPTSDSSATVIYPDSTKQENQQSTDSTITDDKNEINADIKSDFNIQDVKIDIHDYNGNEPLLINTEYKIEAINGTDNGTWRGEGCEITPSSITSKLATMKPTQNSVKIIYSVDNQVKERLLKAK